MSKKITPHKGGRTERLGIRITPANKERLRLAAELSGISVADVIGHWVSNELAFSTRDDTPLKP